MYCEKLKKYKIKFEREDIKMKELKVSEVLEISAKIGAGVGVGAVACIATLKGAMHLCDACYNAGKKLQHEIIKKKANDLYVFGEEDKEQESDDIEDIDGENTDPETLHEQAMKILDDALNDDETSEA